MGTYREKDVENLTIHGPEGTEEISYGDLRGDAANTYDVQFRETRLFHNFSITNWVSKDMFLDLHSRYRSERRVPAKKVRNLD